MGLSAASSALLRLSPSAGRRAKPWGRCWFSISAISASVRPLAAPPMRPEPNSNACQWPDMMQRHSAIMSSMPAPRLSQRPSRRPRRPVTFRRFSPPTLISMATMPGFPNSRNLRSHMLLERGGIRFGLFGMMGTDSIQFTINPGAVTFSDPIETGRKVARQLRAEGADVVICLSHCGVREPKRGPITEGEDIDLARAVPEIDVIVGGHTHTFMRQPIIANGTPVVQAGCYGAALGELVIRMEGGKRKVESYKLHTIDDAIPGDPRLAKALEAFKGETSRILFAPRGFAIDEPLAVIDRDWSNTFFDLTASMPLGNLTADAIRHAAKADVVLIAAGMVRA